MTDEPRDPKPRRRRKAVARVDAMPDAEPAGAAGQGQPADIAPLTDPHTDGSGAPSRDEMTVALTPSQLAVGGVVLAGIVLLGARLIFGRRRGRR